MRCSPGERRSYEGDAEAAIALAAAIVDADPYDEPAHRALADACERAGDMAAAERARRRLDESVADLLRKDS